MFLSRTLTSSVLAFACLTLVATARPDPPTDGLVWEKDFPKSLVVAGVGQIVVSGTIDKTKYPNSRILDKDGVLTVEIYELDKDGKAKEPALYSKKEISVNDVKNSFNGATKRSGGFPLGLYEVRVKSTEFREDVNVQPRSAILIKEKFELK